MRRALATSATTTASALILSALVAGPASAGHRSDPAPAPVECATASAAVDAALASVGETKATYTAYESPTRKLLAAKRKAAEAELADARKLARKLAKALATPGDLTAVDDLRAQLERLRDEIREIERKLRSEPDLRDQVKADRKLAKSAYKDATRALKDAQAALKTCTPATTG